MRILIVKTSSLGDIIQAFPVLNDLASRFPEASIDWVVEESISAVVSSHPLIHRAISIPLVQLKKRPFSLESWASIWSSLKELRKEPYQLVFDLQGNCKSGILTFLSRGTKKVGYHLNSVREWPNVLATHARFAVPKEMNIRKQHLSLLQQFFRDKSKKAVEGVRFKIELQELKAIEKVLSRPELQSSLKVMVCPGSKWINKQLPLETLIALLLPVREKYQASFLLVWGSNEEKQYCETIQSRLNECSTIADRMSISTWQYLMNEMALIIAMDSSALHLCGTTSVPSFSVFGPTSSVIFKPMGDQHFAFQGTCPYGRKFHKQCPILRSCETGACVRGLSAEKLFLAFTQWWEAHLRQCQ